MCAPVEVLADLVERLLGGGAADFGLGAGAEALGDLQPIWMMRSARDEASACASVLATTKSTPDNPARSCC
jgi:hypothetical protein